MRALIQVALLTGGAGFLVGCGGAQSAHDVAVRHAVTQAAYRVSPARCVGSWQAKAAGPQSYPLVNVGRQPLEVTLINAASGDVYGQVTQLDPGTRRPLQADPPAGNYRFRCVPRHGVAAVSPIAQSTGSGGTAATALAPLSAEEIDSAVTTYTTAVRTRVARLTAATDALRSSVVHRRIAVAQRRWLVAHLDFASLGAAYGTFGALTDAIDGRADGLPGGGRDPHFTGFLAVERLLWHGGSRGALVAVVDRLDVDIHQLDRRLPNLKIVAGDLPLRAHEILENALQFELTGDTDEGSHTNLATALANVGGTQLVVRALAPAIRLRRPALLTSITTGLVALASDLRVIKAKAGAWPQVSRLPRAAHERLDAEVDGLLEQLAELPGLLQLPPSLALP